MWLPEQRWARSPEVLGCWYRSGRRTRPLRGGAREDGACEPRKDSLSSSDSDDRESATGF